MGKYTAHQYARALTEEAHGKSEKEQRALLTRLSAMLEERNEQNLLPAIIASAETIAAAVRQAHTVRVVSATALTEKEQQALRESIPAQDYLFETNPDLIAGLVVQQGDTVYYASLQSALRELHGALTR